MKVLVTGATGFSGSHLVRHLQGAGVAVRALVRPESLALAGELGDAEVIEGDVRDEDAVERAVSGTERVFHLAALYRQAGFADSVYHDVNVTGTKNVLEAALRNGVGRVVHTSTVGVLGHIENPPADENAPHNPGDVYQRSKLEGEKLALRFGAERGLPVTVVRPAMIWGEGDRRMLKLFRGVARRRFPIIGTGRTVYHFVHIDDLCRGFLLAAESPNAPGKVYIFAGAEPVGITDLVARIARVNDVRPLGIRIPAWPIQMLGSLVEAVCIPFGIEPPIHRRRVDFFTKDRCFSTASARVDLGYDPALTLDEEIGRISAWYRERGWYD